MWRLEPAGPRGPARLELVTRLEVGIPVVLTNGDIALRRTAIVPRLGNIAWPAVLGTLVDELRARVRIREIPIALTVLTPCFERASSFALVDGRRLGVHFRSRPLLRFRTDRLTILFAIWRATHLGDALATDLARGLFHRRARFEIHTNVSDGGRASTRPGSLLRGRVLRLLTHRLAIRPPGLIGLAVGAVS